MNHWNRVQGWGFCIALALVAGSTHAAPQTWLLEDEYGGLIGTFDLDFSAPSTGNIHLDGLQDRYSLPGFVLLDAPSWVGPFQTYNFLTFFSPQTGTTHREEYGGGEYYELRVNDSVLQLGTTQRSLESAGGVYEVAIREVYNYDETTNYCGYFEELYDPETGDYLGEGSCLSYQSDSNYNAQEDNWYLGTLSSPDASPVPLPGGIWLLASSGLWGLVRRIKQR